MVSIQDLPNEILCNICKQLDGINIRTKATEINRDHALDSTDGSIKSIPGLQEFRLVSRQMNEVGTYVMFQKVTLWTDHQSWKDLNSIAAHSTLSRAVRHLMLENVTFVNSSSHPLDNEHKDGERSYGELDISLFPNLVQVATNHWSVIRKEAAAPRKNCILQMLRANVLKIDAYNRSHLQVLQMITAPPHGFRLSLMKFALFLDPPFTQAWGNVLQNDNLMVQLRRVEIAYGTSIEPGQAPDLDFPRIVAAAMRELPHLESITLDHKWWSWHWRPMNLIDLMCDHKWPNLRSCILKFPFATCSQIKSFLQPHVCRLEYLRIEGFPQNDGMNGFCTSEEASIFKSWLESEFLATVWEFVDLLGS